MPLDIPAGVPTDVPADVPALLRGLMRQDLGRPRLTWYGAAGERVELSAKTLDNWVAKTANVLVDTLDAGPSTIVGIDLPAHWRTAVWLLGAWAVGASVVAAPDSAAARRTIDLVVTDRPARHAHPVVVAVALPALAASFGAELPPGAIDAAVEVRSHGDVFVPLIQPVIGGAGETSAAPVEAAHRWAAEAGWPVGVRLLVRTSALPDPLDGRWLLGPLTVGGSVVLVDDLPGGRSAGEVEHLAAQEGVTHRFAA